MFERIKDWYKSGRWDEKRVKDALDKGVITEEQYEEILQAK